MKVDRSDWHELLSLIKNLRASVTAASNAAVEAIAEHAQATQQRTEQQPPAQPERITVDVQIPPAEINRYYAEQRSTQRLQWWTFWATVATFVAVAAYAVVTVLQWRTMDATFGEVRKQTDSAKTASEAATNSANATIEALAISKAALASSERTTILEQRPWLITDVGVGRGNITNGLRLPNGLPPPNALLLPGETTVSMKITNVGKSPAKKVVAYRLLKFMPLSETTTTGQDREMKQITDETFREALLTLSTPSSTIAPTAFTFIDSNNVTLSRDDGLRLAGKRGLLLFIGVIRYTDDFQSKGDKIRETEFCVYFFGDVSKGNMCGRNDMR